MTYNTNFLIEFGFPKLLPNVMLEFFGFGLHVSDFVPNVCMS